MNEREAEVDDDNGGDGGKGRARCELDAALGEDVADVGEGRDRRRPCM
jgi:hypothetical protein